MTMRAVYWHEGMFLRPHHFQAADRHIQETLARGQHWDCHYNWGLRSIDLDTDALANYRIVIRSLKARLRDGSLIAIPEDNSLPVLDIKKEFEATNGNLTVFLALPVLHGTRANVSNDGAAEGLRYFTELARDVADENTGENPQDLPVRLPNVRLLLSTQDTSGYETLPVGHLRKADQGEGVPVLDKSYIPPLLSCDAWKPLLADILQQIFDRVGTKLDVIAERVNAGNITFDSVAQGDRLYFEQLRMLNEASALLNIICFAQGVHPFMVYYELCRLVGQLAIVDPKLRRVPTLPHYDHDDLGTCFSRVKQYIDLLLDFVEKPLYKERPFEGAGLRMQVPGIESAWLEPIWNMYVGVKSELPVDECRRLLQGGKLDMKIGSADRVDEIFKRGMAGLRFSYTNIPPRALPNRPGLIYFQVDRNSQKEEWDNVQRTLSLAVRVNENLIVGDIQGQREITIKTGGQNSTMRFTLFVVPSTAK
jgi:type VI secretion system protein ImpJ